MTGLAESWLHAAAIPEEEWSLLVNALAEPVVQLIAIETQNAKQLGVVAQHLPELAGTRPVLQQTVRFDSDAPEAVWRCTQQMLSTPSTGIPLLILSMDAWPLDDAQRRQLALFWRGMNQLRENWHALAAQIVFLLSPAAYEHLTLNADHLKRWISLKLRLWANSTDLSVLARPGREGFPYHFPIVFDSVLAPSHSMETQGAKARQQRLHLLASQLAEARQRGESDTALLWRYYLPLISGALALGDKAQADSWRQQINRAGLSRPEDLRALTKLDEQLMKPDAPPRFDVFLSHNHSDKPAVRELAKALRKRGLRVWLDEDELIPGKPWRAMLEQGIHACASVAVLIGGGELGPWQNAEMWDILRFVAADNRPLIPVLLPNAPAQPKLPPILANRAWVDLRGGLDEKKLDQLIWGITGNKPAMR